MAIYNASVTRVTIAISTKGESILHMLSTVLLKNPVTFNDSRTLRLVNVYV